MNSIENQEEIKIIAEFMDNYVRKLTPYDLDQDLCIDIYEIVLKLFQSNYLMFGAMNNFIQAVIQTQS